MKPRNFPGRKARRRQAKTALTRRELLTQAQLQLLACPKDIRIRIGAARRNPQEFAS